MEDFHNVIKVGKIPLFFIFSRIFCSVWTMKHSFLTSWFGDFSLSIVRKNFNRKMFRGFANRSIQRCYAKYALQLTTPGRKTKKWNNSVYWIFFGFGWQTVQNYGYQQREQMKTTI